MTPRDNKEKLVAVFLTLIFMVTSFFYLAQPVTISAQAGVPTEVHLNPVIGPTAVIPTGAPKVSLTIADLWGMFVQGVIKAGESAGYTFIRKYVRQGLSNLTKDVWKTLLTGGKGQSEVFQTEPWESFWEGIGNEMIGAGLEGFTQGFQNEYEFKKKKKGLLQGLDINTEGYVDAEKGLFESAGGSSIGPEKRVIQNELDTLPARFEEGSCVADSDERYVFDGNGDITGMQPDQNCKDLRARQTQLIGGLNQLESDKADADKADADLIAGNTGALSEASKTLINVVCKPDPDIALGIFLGLGDQITLKKRKLLCPANVFKNWQNVAANTGARLDEVSLDGWNSLAALVNPNASDLGAAWQLSIGGQNLSTIGRALGETGFLSEANVGQIKNLTDFSGKTTTPASIVRSLAENSIKVQIEEDTRFIPTGYLLADLILTAGSTILSTSLDILIDGLRKKKTVARRTPGQAVERALQRTTVLYNPGMEPGFGGVEAAEARLAQFDKLDLSPPQDWNILAKLGSSSCPEGMDGGIKGGDVDACVMDDKFAQAVKEHITVKEAIERKLIRGEAVVGFDISGEPKTVSWQGNLPYRSLVIMRKYRVLPVSWELAALFMKYKADLAKHACGGGNCTLNTLIRLSKDIQSPFYGMIDENWVLKIPPVQCALQGYGPEVQQLESSQDCDPNHFSQTNGCRTVLRATRAPEQCVDTRTCLDEDDEGKCNQGRYGYCIQEKKIIRFKGEKCEQRFDGCEVFKDTATGQVQPYLKGSLRKNADFGQGACTLQNAGCQWYSSVRQFQWVNATDQRYVLGTNNTAKVRSEGAVKKEWSSSLENRVFFASAAQKCESKAEGCRRVAGPAGTPPYLRLPPDDLKCDQDGVILNEDTSIRVVIPWYKRQDCKEYTQLCKQEFVGCQQYMPEGDTIVVTGKAPGEPGDINQYRCPAACANIYNYAEQKTLFDEVPGNTNNARPAMYFSAATAQKCSIADVGCEEFTNLDEVARGGEGKEYFTYLQRCEKHDNPDTIPASEVFYSFVGSDTAGGQPEKYYVKGETRDNGKYRPVRVDPTRACDAETVERQKYDPRIGTILCREFVDANGEVFYEWTDNLIYLTADCTSYRRTSDGTSGATATYSPQYSRQCTAAAANCREYRAPQAGNVRVISYDNFEGGTIGEWKGTYRENVNFAKVSNEGEVIGDHSLVMRKTEDLHFVSPTYDLIKPLAFSVDRDYQILFNVKGKAGASVRAYLHAKNSSGGYLRFQPLANAAQLNGNWQRVSFDVPIPRTAEQLIDQEILIVATVEQDYQNPRTNIDTVYIDDIIVKEVEGIEYLIRDTWQRNQSCFNKTSDADPTPNFSSPAYPGCSLYRDSQGAQHAIQTFERICPNEMDGCVETRVHIANRSYPFSFKRNQDGTPVVYNAVPGISPGAGRPKCSCERDEAQRDCPQEDAQRGYAFIGEDQDSGECSEWYVQDGQQKYAIYKKGSTLVDQPLYRRTYLITDKAKQCQASDDRCTAYGSPKTLTLIPSLSEDFKNEANTAWKNANSNQSNTADYFLEGQNRYLRSRQGVAQHYTNQYILSPKMYPPLLANTTYKVTFDFRVSSPADGSSIGIRARGAGWSGNPVGTTSHTIQNVTSWQKAEFTFIQPSANSVHLDLVHRNSAQNQPGATFDIDNIVIQPTRVRITNLDATTQKEDWNVAYFKVTPQEARFAQVKFSAGDRSGYDVGICRQQDLGCREYSAGSKGVRTYFRDPGQRVCQPPGSGENDFYYHVCEKSPSIVCRTDNDCPSVGGVSDRCNTNKKELCPASFIRGCPASASGCRKVIDPECKADGTLRNDYGRGAGGAQCTREYYFAEDFDPRTKECNGKVDVEQGCLLINDASKKRYEYRSATTPQDRNPSTITNQAFCSCDRNPSTLECGSAFDASELDPLICYDRHVQGSAATGALLREYTRVPTDLQYNSSDYYANKRTNLTTSSGCPGGGGCDANTLVKIKQDRQCKLWVSCAGSYKEPGREDPVCFKPTLCDRWNEKGNSCANQVKYSGGGVYTGSSGQVAGEYPTGTIIGGKNLAYLSGIARPNYIFPNTRGPAEDWDKNYTTSGGYGFNVHEWKERNTANVPDRTYRALSILPALAGRADITNSCRLYPGQSTLASSKSNVIDACRTNQGSWGIYGFCLEPYPQYRDTYYGGENYFRRVCTNNAEITCENDAACGDNGKCGFNYFENACLTWYPVDRIRGQQNLFQTGRSRELSVYNGPENVYYCAKTATRRVVAKDVNGDPIKIEFQPKSTPRNPVELLEFTPALLKNMEIPVGGHNIYTAQVIIQNETNYRFSINTPQIGIYQDRVLVNPADGLGPTRGREYFLGIANGNKDRRIYEVFHPTGYWTFSKSDIEDYSVVIRGELLDVEAHLPGNNNEILNEFNFRKDERLFDAIERISGTTDIIVYSTGLDYQVITPAIEQEFRNTFDQTDDCPSIPDKGVIIGLKPIFEGPDLGRGATLNKWKVKVCRARTKYDGARGGLIGSVYGAVLGIKIYLNPLPQDEKTLNLNYTETYCQAYVAAVKDGNAVPNRTIESFDSAKEGAVQLPDSAGWDDAQTGADVYKSSGFEWTGCNSAVVEEMQDEPKNIAMPQGMDASSFNCNTIPPQIQEKANDNRIDNPRSDRNIKILGYGIGIDRYGDLGLVHTQIPFQKFYEWRDWGADGIFNLRSEWNGVDGYTYAPPVSSYLNHYWQGATPPLGTKVVAQRQPPQIYGRTKTEVNKFAWDDTVYSSEFDEETIKFWFYTDYDTSTDAGKEAKKKQLPLKEISITFGDGPNGSSGTPLIVERSEKDGKGVNISPPPDGAVQSLDVFSGHGPFTFTYDGPAAGKKVCITVEDTWGARKMRCGTFSKVSKQLPSDSAKTGSAWNVTFSDN